MLNAWVKNVYKQRKQAGKTSVALSPISQPTTLNKQFTVHKPLSIPQRITNFTTGLFTPKSTDLPLLPNSFTHNPQDLLIEALKGNLKR